MSHLPIDQVLPQLMATLAEAPRCVLQAEPGAGKTTRVPLALLQQDYLADQKIIMLEPRRIAARGAAEYMASQLGERCGETVGYRMRQDSAVSSRTRLEVVTEGVFLRMLQEDPSLEGVGMVIFDEFHERNLDSDVALALSLQSAELFREDTPLKLLVMSATLDVEPLQRWLDCPVVVSEGRSFPVESHFSEVVIERRDLVDAVIATIQRALVDNLGSILVFLPGQAEISLCQARLQTRYEGNSDIHIVPLYGQLSMQEQRKAVQPAPVGQRKIVLATNIAESSITIDGVNVVVDSGWSRVAMYDARTGMSRLHAQRISQASATQREGRAGRTAPGVCYRLWTAQQHQQLARHDTPEILQADLTSVALQLLAWGCSDCNDLQWLDAPPQSAYNSALDLLKRLQAIHNNRLTPHGEKLAAIPTHPRLGHMLLRGHAMGAAKQAAQLAAILEDRDPLRHAGADIDKRMAWLKEGKGQAKRLQARAKQLLSSLGQTDKDRDLSNAVLLAQAYPDRVAQQRRSGGGDYKLASGRGARLDPQDDLYGQPYLVVADIGGSAGRSDDSIFLAAALTASELFSELSDGLESADKAHWNEASGRFESQRETRWGELVIESKPLTDVDPLLVKQALIEHVRQKGLRILPWSDAALAWQQRCLFTASVSTEGQWPDMSDDGLLGAIDEWLGPYLNGVKSLAALQKVDLLGALKARLDWQQLQQLDRLAPSHISVPTGRQIAIDYSGEQPVLAVKMQEMFGCPSSPTVGEGRVKVLLHLLSPAQRPLAVTADLSSFWQNAYSDVKKDMKGRYPKHYWPDDPLQAEATQYTKAKMDRDKR